MKQKINKLMIINILCYFSYIYYSYATAIMDVKGLYLVIVAILPYFLVAISSFILYYDEYDRYDIFKLEARIDFIIRMAAMIINFSLYRISQIKFGLVIVILAEMALFCINIYLESCMLKKANAYDKLERDKSYYNINLEDRINFRNQSKALSYSVFDLPLIFIIISSIAGIHKNSAVGFIVLVMLVDICFLGVFFNISYKSLKLFYYDKITVKQNFIKENSYVVFSVLLGIICAGSGLFGLSSGIDFIIICIQVAILIPNAKIRKRRINHVKRVKDNLDMDKM